MKVIVTGGRNYSNAYKMKQILGALNIDELVVGDATGADQLALFVCEESRRPITYQVFKADWNTHGKAAGPIRNRQMLEAHTDALVVAFPGGRGTENCVKQAKELGLTVIRVEE